MTEDQKKCFYWFNKIVVAGCWIIPISGQMMIWANKFFGEAFFHLKGIRILFMSTIVAAGLWQLFFALLLCYSIIAIYCILKKNGLQDKINIQAFVINAFFFLFQASALCLWYIQWYMYKRRFYDVDCNAPGVVDPTACDAARQAARTQGTIYWEVCNLANFIAAMALAIILFSFGTKEEKPEVKTIKVLKQPAAGPVDDPNEIERITETLDNYQNSVDASSMTYTYLGGKSVTAGSTSINDVGEKDEQFLYGDSERDYTEVQIVETELDNMETRIWAQFVRKAGGGSPLLASLTGNKAHEENRRHSEVLRTTDTKDLPQGNVLPYALKSGG